MARDRPSPYGEGGRVTVARGPVPRDLSTAAENARRQSPRMFAAQPGAWRGTGPRPTVKAAIKHGEGQALALREGRRFFTLSRGPVPATLSDL